MSVFRSEIGTEIDIDAMVSVSPMCDAYGAAIRQNGKVYNSWYRVDVDDKGSSVRGGYGDGTSGWITFDDFTRLKPLLVERGWSFGPYTYRGAWLVRGERGARPKHEFGPVSDVEDSREALILRQMAQLVPSAMPWLSRESKDEAILRLMVACDRGDRLIVKTELDKGVDINSRLNQSGDTPLTKCIMCGQSELACWLLDRGADPELSLYNGRTPLVTAAGVGDMRTVERLIEAGVHVDRQMKNGSTALMYAVAKNQLMVARLLIRSGALRELRDNDGWSIEDYARNSGVDISSL